MMFSGKIKRSLNSEIIRKYRNQAVYIGTPITNDLISTLKLIGFQNVEHGETILPPPIGKITTYNAEGYEIVHKDKPKETVYHTVEWPHEEWRGRDRESVVGYIDRPYQRYPRTLVLPPSKEISVFKKNGKELVISKKLYLNDSSINEVLHTINLFLEIFGKCSIFDENLEITDTQLKKVNWKILPSGHFTPGLLQDSIGPIIKNLSEEKQHVIWYRFHFIMKKSPSFLAIGQGGFKGYIVFAFPERQLFILESLLQGNATYVFDENWELLSKRTKQEILMERLQKDRFIHKKNWKYYIHNLLR